MQRTSEELPRTPSSPQRAPYIGYCSRNDLQPRPHECRRVGRTRWRTGDRRKWAPDGC